MNGNRFWIVLINVVNYHLLVLNKVLVVSHNRILVICLV